MTTTLKDYIIGDKNFYRRVLIILLPIIVQNTITNVVSLLDNVMVGRIGTLQMSAVAIVNQFLFVFNLCIFGGISGAGIFATQFAGAKDDEGMRYCFRIKLIICMAILVFANIIFVFFSNQLINLYVVDGTSALDKLSTLSFGKDYINIMIIGLIPFAISQVYSSSLREAGETKIPMYASVVAIFVNLIFNYFLIFGTFGFPRLEVRGAAIATVLSRFVEMFVVAFFAHKRKDNFKFIKDVYKSLHVPKDLCIDVSKKGFPVLINELLWSVGMSFYLQCYSVRGLNVVAAANIASTINNLFNVVLLSIGSAVAIMVGQNLGANDIDSAKKTAWRLIFLSVVSCSVIGIILAILSPYIPNIYNTEIEVKQLATSFLIVIAVMMPISSFTHDSYFIIRAGGKTMITFLFDSGFIWLIGAPIAFVLANYTNINVSLLYFCVLALDIVKAVIGYFLIKKGVWISNIIK